MRESPEPKAEQGEEALMYVASKAKKAVPWNSLFSL